MRKTAFLPGRVIWFTGLSGAGKTTLANALKERLLLSGKTVEVLDGDVLRRTIHKKLGFFRDGAKENSWRTARLAKKKRKEYNYVIVAVITPFSEDRKNVRKMIGDDFVEVFVNCPLEYCIKRDTKGLYKKALAGEIDNLAGISEKIPYEKPQNSEIVLNTAKMGVKKCIDSIVRHISEK